MMQISFGFQIRGFPSSLNPASPFQAFSCRNFLTEASPNSNIFNESKIFEVDDSCPRCRKLISAFADLISEAVGDFRFLKIRVICKASISQALRSARLLLFRARSITKKYKTSLRCSRVSTLSMIVLTRISMKFKDIYPKRVLDSYSLLISSQKFAMYIILALFIMKIKRGVKL